MVDAPSSRALAPPEKRMQVNGVARARQALIRLELPMGAVTLGARDDLVRESPRWRLDEGCTPRVDRDGRPSSTGLGLWVPSVLKPHARNLRINPPPPPRN